MDNAMVGTVRIPEVTRAHITAIESATDLPAFLHGVADLMENFCYRERYEVAGYSPETGRPVHFEWRPFEHFRGYIYLHPSFCSTIEPHASVAAILRGVVDPLWFQHGATVYVVYPFDSADQDGHSVRAGVRVAKATAVEDGGATSADQDRT